MKLLVTISYPSRYRLLATSFLRSLARKYRWRYTGVSTRTHLHVIVLSGVLPDLKRIHELAPDGIYVHVRVIRRNFKRVVEYVFKHRGKRLGDLKTYERVMRLVNRDVRVLRA